MKGITQQETLVATRIRSRIGLCLGVVTLFWSAQLLGKDQSLASPNATSARKRLGRCP